MFHLDTGIRLVLRSVGRMLAKVADLHAGLAPNGAAVSIGAEDIL